MDPETSMLSTPSRKSVISSPPNPVEGSPKKDFSAMPRFPSHSRRNSSDTYTSSDIALPEDYTSWTSLQINPMKKQKTSSETTTPKQPNPSYYSRRRAQNRASQRAFRERKERHVKNLEQQLEDLHQQYEGLLKAYNHQKEDIFTLKSKLHEIHSENRTLRVHHNSRMKVASTMRASRFQGTEETLQLHQNDLLQPQSQSMTPTSNFDTRNSTSRGSISEEHTPFGSLLPLTPAENFDNPGVFSSPDPFLTTGEGSRCYSVNDYQEAQQQGGFNSPTFSKEFATNPAADIFERWT
ncbi:hypothetical protein GJ744_003612 [Endocarpon pusillum]|uniref:Putative transcription factor kapC n=1 Tax=Endocarpon pusillum TaxID=364733 RepID=A0A8H7A9T4_9EURO|nr:hypothetical protein GJ744_003612 [Endocarpon pusillum]